MTNALTETRRAIKELLEAAGLFAFEIVPNVAQPPLVWVGQADPYLTYEGATFGSVIVHHELAVAGRAGINEVTAEDLDLTVLQILEALAGTEHVPVQVGRPGKVALNGQDYPAVQIYVDTEIRPTYTAGA